MSSVVGQPLDANAAEQAGSCTQEPMRLQKYLARAGVASRRAAEALIASGRVAVNGAVVTELGTKVVPGVDVVAVDGGEVVLAGGSVTLMLHKPAGYVTTMSDPQGRPTVAGLVPTGEHPGLYPIGRLDRDTTGLLLFSTDGELGNLLLHPRHHVPKSYVALVEGAPGEHDLARLRQGVLLDDGMTLPAKAELLRGVDEAAARQAVGVGEGAGGYAQRHGGKRSRAVREKGGALVRLTIREGRKRQVRRMLEAVGHPVIALHRESLGPLALDGLPRGQWRLLTDAEVAALRQAASGSPACVREC